MRRVKEVGRKDKFRNTEKLPIKPIPEFIEEWQLGWLGYVRRLEEPRTLKRMWDNTTE